MVCGDSLNFSNETYGMYGALIQYLDKPPTTSGIIKDFTLTIIIIPTGNIHDSLLAATSVYVRVYYIRGPFPRHSKTQNHRSDNIITRTVSYHAN